MIDQGRELNLTGTNREVNDMIKRNFAGPDGAFIGKDEYLRRVKLNGWNVEEYEKNLRNDLTAVALTVILGGAAAMVGGLYMWLTSPLE